MTEPTELLPCPFCGSDNIGHYEVEDRDNHSFECHDCLAGSACKSTYNEALAAWNRRTAPPAVAGELVAPDFYTACGWHDGGGVGGWIALPGYSNETEHGVKHLVLDAARKEGYKGTAAGRLLELGWEIRPVYLTPQPTQAQEAPQSGAKSFQTYAEANAYSRGYYAGKKAATQAQAGAVPLTDAVARNLVWSIESAWNRSDDVNEDDAVELIRATEAAHGIKGGPHAE